MIERALAGPAGQEPGPRNRFDEAFDLYGPREPPSFVKARGRSEWIDGVEKLVSERPEAQIAGYLREVDGALRSHDEHPQLSRSRDCEEQSRQLVWHYGSTLVRPMNMPVADIPDGEFDCPGCLFAPGRRL